MKKTHSNFDPSPKMLKASEALDLALANVGVEAQMNAQKAAAEGSAWLGDALLRIESASKEGRMSAKIEGNSITYNALRGMGYRVHQHDPYGIVVTAHWDPRPTGFWGGLWWDLLTWATKP